MWIKSIQQESLSYEINEDISSLMKLSDEVDCVIQCLKDEIMWHLEDVSEENFPTMDFIKQLHNIKDSYEVENYRIKDKIIWLQRRFNLWMK